jgi:hypothetical protein
MAVAARPFTSAANVEAASRKAPATRAIVATANKISPSLFFEWDGTHPERSKESVTWAKHESVLRRWPVRHKL